MTRLPRAFVICAILAIFDDWWWVTEERDEDRSKARQTQ